MSRSFRRTIAHVPRTRIKPKITAATGNRILGVTLKSDNAPRKIPATPPGSRPVIIPIPISPKGLSPALDTRAETFEPSASLSNDYAIPIAIVAGAAIQYI